MNETTRINRVMGLVSAARKLSDPHSSSGAHVRAALLAQGPLSPEGIELALREHLELEPRCCDLRSLLRAAGSAPRVHIVLSANVFVGALRALAIAVAAAKRVFVRMSRRESVFAASLIEAIDIAELKSSITISDKLSVKDGDEVHLYGRDSSIRSICSTLPPKVLIRAHGTGMGIAAVDKNASISDAAQQLIRDVVVFDQRGCLSPRIVAVQGDFVRAKTMAQALAAELCDAETNVPVGHLEEQLRAERTRYRQSVRVAGELLEVGEASVGVVDAVLIPPVGRNIHVVPCSIDQLECLFSPISSVVSALGVSGSQHAPFSLVMQKMMPRARVSALGKMQRPALDGPVDRRSTLVVNATY